MVDTQDRIKNAANQNRSQILDNVRTRLEHFSDDQMAAVSDPDAISERMARMIPPAPGEFGRLIGPVYSTKALEAMWDITRAAISKRVKENKLFALKVSGASIFPLFQFNGADVRSDVINLMRLMEDAGADRWTIAAWLCTPSSIDKTGRTPIELLDAGENRAVTSAAQRAAERWAQ